MSFGEVLYRIRKEKGDSLRTLAAKMGVSYGYVNQMEKSIRGVSEDFLKKVIKAYPSYRAEFEKAYVEFEISKYEVEVVNKVCLGKLIKEINKENNFDKLLKLVLFGIDKKSKKEILKLVLAQRENEAYRTQTYEANKNLFKEMRKEIRNLR